MGHFRLVSSGLAFFKNLELCMPLLPERFAGKFQPWSTPSHTHQCISEGQPKLAEGQSGVTKKKKTLVPLTLTLLLILKSLKVANKRNTEVLFYSLNTKIYKKQQNYAAKITFQNQYLRILAHWMLTTHALQCVPIFWTIFATTTRVHTNLSPLVCEK